MALLFWVGRLIRSTVGRLTSCLHYPGFWHENTSVSSISFSVFLSLSFSPDFHVSCVSFVALSSLSLSSSLSLCLFFFFFCYYTFPPTQTQKYTQIDCSRPRSNAMTLTLTVGQRQRSLTKTSGGTRYASSRLMPPVSDVKWPSDPSFTLSSSSSSLLSSDLTFIFIFAVALVEESTVL